MTVSSLLPWLAQLEAERILVRVNLVRTSHWALAGSVMKKTVAAIALWYVITSSATAGTLSAADAERLRADVAAITTSVERGDAEALIARTHPSLHSLVGGPEAFAKVTRQSVEQLRQSGVKFLSSEIGMPTRTHSAGDEEVCFVPRISVMELQGKKVRSTTFMIAIRHVGETDWKYLDGAGLRKHPEMLYQLLPELERPIALPPNAIEAL
jgi:hypothetical protein